MLIRAGYEIGFMAFAQTPMVALLNLRPERVDVLRSTHLVLNDRGVVGTDYRDTYGNVCTRMTLPTGLTRLSCDFVIECDGRPDRQPDNAPIQAVEELPDDVLMYLVGSRYCDTDLLSSTAWSLFGHIPADSRRVHAIVDFVHQHLTYGYQYARATRTAAEAFRERVGVCRDFAHLAIALCRCMNIPARYCSGYLGDIGVPPMDFHAWFEAYLGGEWYSFDARHRVPRIGRIEMAYGRDAADCALTTTFGTVQLASFKVHTDGVCETQVSLHSPLKLVA